MRRGWSWGETGQGGRRSEGVRSAAVGESRAPLVLQAAAHALHVEEYVEGQRDEAHKGGRAGHRDRERQIRVAERAPPTCNPRVSNSAWASGAARR